MDSKIPEFEPPTAAVARIVKGILPPNVMLTKDARAAFTRAAGIFIFYLTHCANDFSRESKRQTIFAQDIKNALRELDFEDFLTPLDEFLDLYRKAQQNVDTEKRASKKVTAEAGGDGEDAEMQIEGEDIEDVMDEQEEDDEEQEQDDEEEEAEEEDPEEDA